MCNDMNCKYQSYAGDCTRQSKPVDAACREEDQEEDWEESDD